MSTVPAPRPRIEPQTRRRIESPLHKLRGTIRRYIAWESIALGIILLTTAFWIGLVFDYGTFKITGIDWVQYLPRAFRLIVLLVAGGLFTLIMLMALLRLTREFAPAALALVLERRFPRLLRDRLITAVELTDLDKAEEYGYSRDMIIETVRQVSEKVDQLPVKSVFNWGRLYGRWVIVFVVTLGVLLPIAGAYLGWNRTLNVGNFAWSFAHVSGTWFERNVLMRNTLWPRRAYLEILDFPASGELRIGRDAPSPRIRVRALKWVVADREAENGWRALTWADLSPDLIGGAAPTLPTALLVPPAEAPNAPSADDPFWTVDRVEQALDQEDVRQRLLAGGISDDDYLALRSTIERLDEQTQRASMARTLRKLEVPREVKIYYWGAKSSDEAPLARQQQGVNEYAVVLTDLKESVKFYVKGEDFSTFPHRRITLVPPPMLTRLERDEYLPAYQYHRPPADGSAADLRGQQQIRRGLGVSLTGGTSRLEIAHGSRLVLRGELDKDLAEARVRYRSAKGDDSGRVDSLPIGSDRRSIAIDFPSITTPIEFDFEFTDTDNVKSLRHIVIQPIDDRTPDVNVAIETIRRTNQGYMCTPYALIPVSGTVRDDVGLSRVEYSLSYSRFESAQVVGLRAAILAGFLGGAPSTGSPWTLFGTAGVVDFLTRLAESREAAVAPPPIPLLTFTEIVAEKNREHAYGKDRLPQLLADAPPNLDELRRQRMITQFDIRPIEEAALDLREQVPDFQKGLDDNIRPRFRLRLTVQAVDNNIETGPRTGQNRETFTFVVVPYEELLAEMNKDEEVLAYKSQELSDKMIDLRNGIDKVEERTPGADGPDEEFRSVANRMEENLAELEKGSDLTRELLAECSRLLKESQTNRLPTNFIETKERLVNLLDEALRVHFENARTAHGLLRDTLQARRVPDLAIVAGSRQRQEELNRQLDLVRDLLGRAIDVTRLAKNLDVLIQGRLEFDRLVKLFLEEEKYEIELALAELAPRAAPIDLVKNESKRFPIELGRDDFVKGPLMVKLTPPEGSDLKVPEPLRVGVGVETAQVEITAGNKTGTFDVPVTITSPKGTTLRFKDDQPLVLKVTVK